MGRTKALVEVDGRPMAGRVLDALSAAGCSPLIVVGGDESELATLGVPVVADRHPGEGPVGGVITAMTELANDADLVVVVACDLPFLDDRAVARLIDSSDDVVAVARTVRLEPLCAAWPSSVLDPVERAFADGTRAMHALLDRLDTVEVDLDAEPLRNINRPEDLGR
jgi:molybdopterin-guanine dinucleotide biosynthesis protein A